MIINVLTHVLYRFFHRSRYFFILTFQYQPGKCQIAIRISSRTSCSSAKRTWLRPVSFSGMKYEKMTSERKFSNGGALGLLPMLSKALDRLNKKPLISC